MLCCCTSCATSCCGSCCKAVGGGAGRLAPSAGYSTRIPYLLFMFLGIVVAMTLREWGTETLFDLYVFDVQACTEASCLGNQAVLRMSFAMMLFFLTMTALMISPSTSGLHHTCWAGKFLYYIGLIVISYILPDRVFVVYAQISMFGSAIFLFLQLVLLIDLAYEWNYMAVQLAEDRDDTRYLYGIVGISFVLLGASVAAWIVSFNLFTQESSCGLEQFFIVFTIILSLISLFLSLSDRTHGALFPSSVIIFYAAFLLYNGLKSDPSSCNTFFEDEGSSALEIIIGIAIAGVSITYTSWSLTSKSKRFFNTGEDPETIELEEKVDDKEEEQKIGALEIENGVLESEQVLLDPETQKTNRIFHMIMTLAAMYMGMLLTGWSTNLEDDSGSINVLSKQSMWVNIVTQWICFMLFNWTLIAPLLFPDRDFGHD